MFHVFESGNIYDGTGSAQELVAPKMVLLIDHTLSCFLYSYTRLRTSSHGNTSGYFWSWIVYNNGEVKTSSGYTNNSPTSVVLGVKQLRLRTSCTERSGNQYGQHILVRENGQIMAYYYPNDYHSVVLKLILVEDE